MLWSSGEAWWSDQGCCTKWDKGGEGRGVVRFSSLWEYGDVLRFLHLCALTATLSFSSWYYYMCAPMYVCVQSWYSYRILSGPSRYWRTLRQTHTYTHAVACTFLIANHVWVLIHRIRSLIELDQHVLALRGFLHMHFVWDCNRHSYYHCCYSGKRIISADYRQRFERFLKKSKTSYTTHSVRRKYCA